MGMHTQCQGLHLPQPCTILQPAVPTYGITCIESCQGVTRASAASPHLQTNYNQNPQNVISRAKIHTVWPFWQDIVFFKSESGAGYPAGPFLENTITTYTTVNAYTEIWAQACINWHIWPSRHPTATNVNKMTTNHCQVMEHKYIKLGNDVSWKETHKKYRHPIPISYSTPNTSPIAGKWQARQ
jgi:hypothetical protein